MLRDDETWHNFQRFGGTRERPRIDLLTAHGLFTRSRGRSGGNRPLSAWCSKRPRRNTVGGHGVSGCCATRSPLLYRHWLSLDMSILTAMRCVDLELRKPGWHHALRRGRRCNGHQIDQHQSGNAQRSTHRSTPAATIKTNESHRDARQAMLQWREKDLTSQV